MYILVINVQSGGVNRIILVRLLFRKIHYHVHINVLYVSQLLIIILCMCVFMCVHMCVFEGWWIETQM